MARYVRLYNSPDAGRPASLLGFSNSVGKAAEEPQLEAWLNDRGYKVTHESEEQNQSKLSLGWLTMGTTAYREAPGIPIPTGTVSATHLQIEPPIADEDVLPLGYQLSQLSSLNDGGMRRYVFIDNRSIEPETYGEAGKVIAWG